MIERMADLPENVVGVRASGTVTADDYRTVLEPALRAAAESGEIRLLYVLDAGTKLDAGAMLQDAQTGLTVGIAHHSAWQRTAVVTDQEWIAHSVRLFAWMMPGEVRAFALAELAQARDWVAA